MNSEQVRPLSVLIVEDRDEVADSTADLLTYYGHQVRIARCGRDALAEAAAAPPDVVLMDIGLPDMDGWAVTRELRSGGCQPIVVALTGRTNDADRRASSEAGIAFHLVKPVDPKLVVDLLARIAVRKRASMEILVAENV